MTNPVAKWMRKEDDQLRAAAASGETVAAISKRLCRSESGVLHRADKLGIELASRQAPAGRDREPQMSPHHSNDDKSPLIDLLVCIICRETMKIEKSTPDAGVRTSSNIVVGGVIELSGCDSSAEVEMRRR